MSDVLAALGNTVSPSLSPAIAAAVTLLNSTSQASPLHRLDLALRAVAPHLTSAERTAWAAALARPLAKVGITSARCLAVLVGQCAQESGGFRDLEEDLSYSAERLCQVWPARFPTQEAAAACALQPEALANRVYADRMGNGDARSGDGWRFRGRGLIQITGRSAYERFAHAMGLSLDQAVAHAATLAGAADSAVWFWQDNELTALAEAWSIDLITRKINGGSTDAAERSRLCAAALHAIGV